MFNKHRLQWFVVCAWLAGFFWVGSNHFSSFAQLPDKTLTPNIASDGINKSLTQQIGAGRGDWQTPDSSSFIIARDPFRSIRRGRQLFQRKFLRAQGLGPLTQDGIGDLNVTLALGAGLSDSCASCHGRPRGSAGAGGDVVTRPDSRDAPHLFGLGLKEMLADEITADLRAIRTDAIKKARNEGRDITCDLASKGIHFGEITAHANGSVDASHVEGLDEDLRVRPFFAHGSSFSIREFAIGAWNDEMGLQAVDDDTLAAHNGATVTTPSGLVLNGALDKIKAPPVSNAQQDGDNDGIISEIPTSLVDHMEFYLLNYFKAATYEQDNRTGQGLRLFKRVGCAECHIPDLRINRDRRVADVETVYDTERGIFNNLFATAIPLFREMRDSNALPSVKAPRLRPFEVKNIFTDLKRHDLGPNFHERNYDVTIQKLFLTTPLWGVGTTAPYGHDGRSINLQEVILRHGGEAQASRDEFAQLSNANRRALLDFLQCLVLFPPDDTASNLDVGDRNAAGFPQYKHGGIRLTALFNDPTDIE